MFIEKEKEWKYHNVNYLPLSLSLSLSCSLAFFPSEYSQGVILPSHNTPKNKKVPESSKSNAGSKSQTPSSSSTDNGKGLLAEGKYIPFCFMIVWSLYRIIFYFLWMSQSLLPHHCAFENSRLMFIY